MKWNKKRGAYEATKQTLWKGMTNALFPTKTFIKIFLGFTWKDYYAYDYYKYLYL